MTDETPGAPGNRPGGPGGPAHHLDPDQVADLLEGLLPEDQAHTAEAHLAGCADCAALRDDLAAVPGLLAAGSAADPMPADVVDRVGAALAGAQATLTAAPTVVPLRAAARASWQMRLTQAAAVIVLLLAGVGVVLSVLGSGEDAGTSDAAGGQAAGPRAADSGGYPVTASGRDWTLRSLQKEAPSMVAGTFGADVAAEPRSEGSGAEEGPALTSNPAARLAGGPELAECVGNLALGPVTPLAVDLASWEGKPAAVIIVPTPDDPTTADVYVVDPQCPPGEMLVFLRVPRP